MSSLNLIDLEEARKRLNRPKGGYHWQRMEDGWYLCPNVGEIVLNYFEKNGQWWFLPAWDETATYGPYATLKLAKKAIRNKQRPPTTRVRLDDQSAGETVKALSRGSEDQPPAVRQDSGGCASNDPRSWPGYGNGTPKRDEPKERVFVVGDAHGDWNTMRDLLIAAKAVHVDLGTNRLFPLLRTKLVHIGDLISATKKSKDEDLRILDEAGKIFDVLLVGNHEHPYFSEQATGTIPQHKDFKHDGDVKDEIERLKHKYLAAYEFDGTLISHAGLVRDYESAFENAEDAVREINTKWFDDASDSLFTRIGPARGGKHQSGGLMWSDWDEPKSRAFTQVVGHSPGQKPRQRPFTKFNTAAFCIDVANTHTTKKMSGIWLEKGGTVQVISVPASKKKEETDGDAS